MRGSRISHLKMFLTARLAGCDWKNSRKQLGRAVAIEDLLAGEEEKVSGQSSGGRRRGGLHRAQARLHRQMPTLGRWARPRDTLDSGDGPHSVCLHLPGHQQTYSSPSCIRDPHALLSVKHPSTFRSFLGVWVFAPSSFFTVRIP